MDKRLLTQNELLNVIAVSEYEQKNHVLFIPPNTEYVLTLNTLKRKKLIESKGLTSYVLTKKGWRKLRQQAVSEQLQKKYNEVDKFIDQL